MKFMKRVAILLVFLSLGYFMSAQGLYVGAKFGPSFVNLTGDDVNNNKMKTSFMGGAFAGYGFGDIISASDHCIDCSKALYISSS